MKRPFSIVLSAAVFTSVIAGALTFSTLKLVQPKSASATAAAPPQGVVSAGSNAFPTIVGTDHPVPVSSPVEVAASPESNAPNAPATPVPQASALVENAFSHQAESPSDNSSRDEVRSISDSASHHEAQSLSDNSSRQEAESPAGLVREKAEQAREKAERLRARVEDLYQSRRISETAYKEGQAEYQRELTEYEDRMAKLRSTTTGTGASDE